LINSGHNQIILDLSDVTYVDSTGVGILVSSFTTARRGGGDVKLVGLTKRVRELLQIVKLLTIFEVFESVDAALQDVAKPRLEVVKRAAGEN
jgi:anti-sigma B factor antagonist